PRDQPQQRRLAGAVPPDQGDRLARLDRGRDAVERLDVRAAGATPRDEQLLERPRRLRVDAEAAADGRDLDRARAHRAGTPAIARSTSPARTETKAGSAFGISIRDSSSPSPHAFSTASTSTSQRISR